MNETSVTEKGEALGVAAGESTFAINRETGEIQSWQTCGTELLATPLSLNLWRAPTDNDRCGWGLEMEAHREWRKCGLDCLKARIEIFDFQTIHNGNAIRVNTRGNLQADGNGIIISFSQEYIICGDGSLLIFAWVDHSSLHGSVNHMPRVGLTMQLDPAYDTFSWLGRGPHECYADRQFSAPVGRYSSSVADQYVPYIVPQEHGNHTEVRWAAVTDKSGKGLLARGEKLINASASIYTAEMLDQCRHTYELEPCGNTVFNIDALQSGLGNASCGPGILDRYKLLPGQTSFRMILRPLAAGDDPARTGREGYEMA